MSAARHCFLSYTVQVLSETTMPRVGEVTKTSAQPLHREWLDSSNSPLASSGLSLDCGLSVLMLKSFPSEPLLIRGTCNGCCNKLRAWPQLNSTGEVPVRL